MSYGAIGGEISNRPLQAQSPVKANAARMMFKDLAYDISNNLKQISTKIAKFKRLLGPQYLDLNERPQRIHFNGIQTEINGLVMSVLSSIRSLTELGSNYSEDQLEQLNRMRNGFLESVEEYEQIQQKLFQKIDNIFGSLADVMDEEETDSGVLRPHVTKEEQELRRKKGIANEAIRQQTDVMLDVGDIQSRVNAAFDNMRRTIDAALDESRQRAESGRRTRVVTINPDSDWNVNDPRNHLLPGPQSSWCRPAPTWESRCCCVTIVTTCVLLIVVIVTLTALYALGLASPWLRPITGP